MSLELLGGKCIGNLLKFPYRSSRAESKNAMLQHRIAAVIRCAGQKIGQEWATALPDMYEESKTREKEVRTSIR